MMQSGDLQSRIYEKSYSNNFKNFMIITLKIYGYVFKGETI